MKSISKRMKAVYALLVTMMLCACLLIVPGMQKTVMADEPSATQSAAAAKIEIKSAQFSTNGTTWAIMFNAQIDIASYNVLTNTGADSVKLGVLVGPAKRLDAITDYDTAIAQDFEAKAHVGTESAGVQVIDFAGEDVYNYFVGVSYDTSALSGEDLKAVAALELAAIPYWVDSTETAHTVLSNVKTAVPTAILVESYLLNERPAEGAMATAVAEYAGTVNATTTFEENETYVCKDSARLMNAGADNNLVPYSMDLAATSKIYLSGKKVGASVNADDETKLNTTALVADDTAKLISNDSIQNLIICNADGTVDVQEVKVAQRVIARWEAAEYYSYNGGLYNPAGNGKPTEAKDYMMKENLDGIGVNKYKSVFYVTTSVPGYGNSVTGAGWTTEHSPNQAVDGLYVLANNLKPFYNANTLKTHGGALQQLYPTNGYGFIGTFDGRGNTISTINDARSTTVGNYGLDPIFPTVTAGGTVRNTGFEFHTVGGYYQPNTMFSTALNANFENIYVKIREVTQRAGRYQIPSIGAMQDCTIKNFVIDADCLDTTPDGGVGVGSGQQLNSLILFHNFGAGAFGFKKTTSVLVEGTEDQWDTTETDGDGFAGNTATNLFAVGSSILFVKQEETTVNAATNDATYLINPYSDLAKDLSYEEKLGEYVNQTYVAEIAYEENTLAQFNTLAEIAVEHKLRLYNASKTVSALNIRFIAREGFYDMADADEFATFIKDAENATAISQFSADFWNVDTAAGTITWKSI